MTKAWIPLKFKSSTGVVILWIEWGIRAGSGSFDDDVACTDDNSQQVIREQAYLPYNDTLEPTLEEMKPLPLKAKSIKGLAAEYLKGKLGRNNNLGQAFLSLLEKLLSRKRYFSPAALLSVELFDTKLH